MEVYIDLLLLENTLINIFMLLVTLKLSKIKYKIYWVYLAAGIGAFYTLSIFSNIRILTSFIFKILIAFIMIYISIEEKKFINALKATGILFFIAFVLGGINFSFVLIQNKYSISQNFTINGYSYKYLIISVIAIYLFASRILAYLKERTLIKNFTYDIYIDTGGNGLLIKGFLDTGNELREPVTNLPCIIVENKYLEKLNIKEEEKFIINYRTIKDEGSIKGFKGKDIRIRNCESRNWISIEAVICECNSSLSKENDFQALLSRGVV